MSGLSEWEETELAAWFPESHAIPKFVRVLIFRRDNWRCYLCGIQVVMQPKKGGDNRATIDHVIPKSAGGTSHSANLKTCCSKCNFAKDSMTLRDYEIQKRYYK